MPDPVTVHRLSRKPGPDVLHDPDGTALHRLGLAPSDIAHYLIRPDGHIGYRAGGAVPGDVALRHRGRRDKPHRGRRRPWVDRDRVERRRQRLLRVQRGTHRGGGLQHRLRQPGQGRRVGGRGPEHRCGSLRQLPAVGWLVFGGTSVAAPIIAGVYGLAGNAASFDNNFPYAHSGSLFDITSGSNGSCSPAQLCTARVGWDGPTGLGTPNFAGGF
jgi:hypothetical protein